MCDGESSSVLQIRDATWNLSSESVSGEQSSHSLHLQGSFVAITIMNVPGDAGVCSKTAVAYPESHVAVAPAAACSVSSKHLVYSCTSNCSAALLFALCENVVQL